MSKITFQYQWLCKSPVCLIIPFPSTLTSKSSLSISKTSLSQRRIIRAEEEISKRRGVIVCGAIPAIVDPWAPNIDSQSIASQFFAFSLFPYIGFLYFITKSNSAPKLTLFGFYFLLTFVAATILIILTSFALIFFYKTVPAGIYAKVQYGTSLSNVDWLHGAAESFLTLTNLFIVMGLREALRNATQEEQEDNEASI